METTLPASDMLIKKHRLTKLRLSKPETLLSKHKLNKISEDFGRFLLSFYIKTSYIL